MDPARGNERHLETGGASAAGLLPESVLERPKTGFGAPVRQWMRRELRAMAGDLLSAQALRASGWFSPQAVAELREGFESGQEDHGYSLWALLMVQIWRAAFFRQPVT
jgi:asparagine synthase (glutamine-hydrolysing)